MLSVFPRTSLAPHSALQPLRALPAAAADHTRCELQALLPDAGGRAGNSALPCSRELLLRLDHWGVTRPGASEGSFSGAREQPVGRAIAIPLDVTPALAPQAELLALP